MSWVNRTILCRIKRNFLHLCVFVDHKIRCVIIQNIIAKDAKCVNCYDFARQMSNIKLVGNIKRALTV